MLKLLQGIRGRKGDMSVTVFVILVVAVLIFSLLSFSLSSISVYKEIAEGYKAVEEFNVAYKAAEFDSGQEASRVAITKSHKSGVLSWIGAGKDVLDIDVRVNLVP